MCVNFHLSFSLLFSPSLPSLNLFSSPPYFFLNILSFFNLLQFVIIYSISGSPYFLCSILNLFYISTRYSHFLHKLLKSITSISFIPLSPSSTTNTLSPFIFLPLRFAFLVVQENNNNNETELGCLAFLKGPTCTPLSLWLTFPIRTATYNLLSNMRLSHSAGQTFGRRIITHNYPFNYLDNYSVWD